MLLLCETLNHINFFSIKYSTESNNILLSFYLFIVCNRTLYGDVGKTYEIEIPKPKVFPFLCHLNFTAPGGLHGDIIQVSIILSLLMSFLQCRLHNHYAYMDMYLVVYSPFLPNKKKRKKKIIVMFDYVVYASLGDAVKNFFILISFILYIHSL